MKTKVADLTDRQKQCLRLVGAGFQSKEIAAKLGLSPHTVDQHLREAIRALGVSRRIEAARLLIDIEGGSPAPAVAINGQPKRVGKTVGWVAALGIAAVAAAQWSADSVAPPSPAPASLAAPEEVQPSLSPASVATGTAMALKAVTSNQRVTTKNVTPTARRRGFHPNSAACPCSGESVCVGPRGGRYCITSGGNKRYGV
jgi:DNA-binding CsgD family transcriptional regulator